MTTTSLFTRKLANTPFMSWAGSKRQLVPHIETVAPVEFDNYYELFAGSGALFFMYGQNAKNKAYLNDINHIAILVYQFIKLHLDSLIVEVDKIKAQFGDSFRQAFEESKRKVNEYLLAERSDLDLETAASALYMMKTSYSTVFQMSKKGNCTSQFHSATRGNIYSYGNLKECSEALRRTDAQLSSLDFTQFSPQKGDFVYLDPPYDTEGPLYQYWKKRFSREDQVRLRDYCVGLREKGVSFVLSNSATDFTVDLYSDFEMGFLDAKRGILQKNRKDFRAKEILVYFKN